MPEKTNPYVAGAPVTDRRMFFGREDVFTWIEHNIGGQFSDNMLVIHGQRRVGKTSVLKQLGNYISDKYIPVFFDFQGRTHTTLNRFLYRLAREIVRTLSREHDIKVPRPDRGDFEQDAEQFAGPFLSQVREALGDKNLVLVFDEFDTLEERTARDMLGQYLVPYFSRMVHGAERLNFIFSIGSSGHKLEDMRAEYTDFFRVGLYKRISFLSPPDARRLIAEPVRGIMDYEEDAIDRIVEITSGHPYFIQLLCHELFARAQRMDDWHIDLMDVEEVLPDVIERGTVNLKFVWDVATSSERYTLAALAEMGQEATKEEVLALLQEHKVRISDEEVGQALLELNARDVLSKQNGFTVELLRLWLLENRPLKRVIEELSEKHPVAVRHTQIAEEYREQDQIEGALENYQSALASAPNYIPARLGMADIYQESGRWIEAVEAYQKVLTIDAASDQAKSGLSETLVALGDAAREAGDVEGALERYREALEVDEEHFEARERLAGLYLSQSETQAKQGKWQPAGESLLTAWEYIPEGIQIEEKPSPTALQDLENVEQLAQVIAPLREALAFMRAQLAREQLNRALKLREGKKYSAALTRLEKALAYDPDLEEVQREIRVTRELERDAGLDNMYTAGQRAFRAQRWGEAISTLQRYLEFEPEDESQVKQAQAWIEEARVQEELAERYAAARQAMDRGITRRALALLREIRDVAGEYRDTEQLLDQVRMKWRGGVLRQAALWGGIAILMGVVGWWLLKPGGALQPAAVGWGLYDNTPTATATALPPTSTPPATQPPSPTPEPTSVPLAWQRLTSAQFVERDTLTAIAIDPTDSDVIYVGTNNAGIYKSIDGGISWRPASQGMEHKRGIDLIISPDDPSILYAASEGGSYKSTDGGEHWKMISNSNKIVMDPQDSQHLYGAGHVLPESLDGGASWLEIQETRCPDNILELVIHPERREVLFAINEHWAGDCENGVYRSDDGGRTWEIIGLQSERVQALSIDSQNGEYLYAATEGNGGLGELHVSIDEGETWKQVLPMSERTDPDSIGAACLDIFVDHHDGSIVYCRDPQRVLKSTNAGQTWQVLSEVEYPALAENVLLVSPQDPNTIYLGVQGLKLSVDGGRTWSDRSSGLGAIPMNLRLNPTYPSKMYAEESCQSANCRLYLSKDAGRTWEFVTEQNQGLAIDAAGDIIYRGRNLNLIQSRDAGETWAWLDTLAIDIEDSDYKNFHASAHPFRTDIVYVVVTDASSQPAIYRSLDGGDTWQLTDANWEEFPSWNDWDKHALYFDHDQGDVVYQAGGELENTLRSSDGGQSWERCGDFHDFGGLLLSQQYTRLAVDPDDSDRLLVAGSNGELLVSADGCQTWELSNYGLSSANVNTVAFDVQNPDTVYAGTNSGAYVSFDGGENWSPINDGLLGGLVVYSIVVDEESNVYAATPLGIFTLRDK